MGKLQVRTCDVPLCSRRPVHTWLISGPSATYSVDLCNEDASPVLLVARLGKQTGTPRSSEAERMDTLWKQ